MGREKIKKNKREERDRKRGEENHKEGIYRREGEGSNITPCLGAAAPRRVPVQRKGRSTLGWDSGWWIMLYKRGVGPSSTRPPHESRERGRVGEGERERRGRGERSCSGRL